MIQHMLLFSGHANRPDRSAQLAVCSHVAARFNGRKREKQREGVAANCRSRCYCSRRRYAYECARERVIGLHNGEQALACRFLSPCACLFIGVVQSLQRFRQWRRRRARCDVFGRTSCASSQRASGERSIVPQFVAGQRCIRIKVSCFA